MELRKTEVWRDGAWVQVPLITVKKGDRFRMFEPDGVPITDGAGQTEWQAVEDARTCLSSVEVIAGTFVACDPLTGGPEDAKPYFRDCPFCGKLHQSFYVDELEETVLACRDRNPDRTGALLQKWALEFEFSTPAVELFREEDARPRLVRWFHNLRRSVRRWWPCSMGA